jgi:membrane protease subunit HflK
MLKLFMNNGPWGPWNNSGKNTNPEQNFGSQKPQKPNANFDDFFKKSEEFFKKIFEQNNKNNGGNNGGGDDSGNDRWKKIFDKSSKSVAGLFILGFILLWLMLGIYKVDPDENAAVLYFGKFYSIATPGLNYHIPYPFGQVIKKSVTVVNTEEFGFSSNSKKSEKRNFDAESLMLTGDENIVDIEFQVQWQIADIKDFIFNIAEPNQAIRKSAESAMREIIARAPIADALSDGKKRIEQETRDLLQQTLDSYGAGVRITLVQLRRVDPPLQVIDAFRDVQTAKADKEKEINQAQSYANDIIPRARGTASQVKEQSEAYANEVVANSQGEAGRFLSVYNQYAKAKQVTKKRIYLETMEKIYRDMDKIFIDKGAAKAGVMPYFPLNELPQTKKPN